MSITSYAQNFEDVMLWRALGHVEKGCYIDIGAQDPVIDSVSLAFYEHGWRGIHVEPVSHYANLLRESRPEDVVIQAAVGSKDGALTFFEFPETGLSTADRNIAKQHKDAGHQMREIVVPCVTLADVFSQCAKGDIHWLKIDVEGYERHVLKGWQTASTRPWIIVVESTLPLTQTESHREWERLVLKRGYRFAYFDGVNRFYVSEAHLELLDKFRVGPNVFDDFTLNGTASAPFCTSLNEKVHALEEQSRQEKEASQQEALRLSQALAEREQQLGAQLQASQQEALRLSQALAEREQALGTQLQASQQEALRLSNALAEREQALGAQLQTSQQEALRLSQALSDTRSEGEALRQHLVAAQQQAARAEGELTQTRERIGALEQTLSNTRSEGEALRQHLVAAQQQAARAEGELTQTRERISALEQALAERERELGAQLQANQQEIQRLHQVLDETNAWGQSALTRIHAMDHQLAKLYRSRSWRVTAPLRAVANRGRGLFAAFRALLRASARFAATVLRSTTPALFKRLAHNALVRRVYERVVAQPVAVTLGTPSGAVVAAPQSPAATVSIATTALNAESSLHASMVRAVRAWPLGERVDG